VHRIAAVELKIDIATRLAHPNGAFSAAQDSETQSRHKHLHHRFEVSLIKPVRNMIELHIFNPPARLNGG
jgi:hypothetical protein